jgi:nucleoside-diphosphate-sugar epimerase
MTKICVTGATGFIGSKLSLKLSQLSYDVLAPVRNLSSSSLSLNQNLQYIKVEKEDSNLNYSKILKQVDTVIHCAARTHVVREVEKNPQIAYQKINVEETLNLATQAASFGVKRFIFLSSIKVNGEKTLRSESFKHNDIAMPEDAYGVSKLKAEKVLRELSDRTGLEIVIIRAPLVYGEGVKGNFLRLLNLTNKKIPLPFARINNIRSLVGLDNLIDLIICCIDHPKAAGQIFLISDNESISTPELIKRIGAAMGKSTRLFPVPLSIFKLLGRLMGKSYEVDKLLGSLMVDTSHTRQILGWKPILSLDDGLNKTVQWYLKNL